MQERRDAVHEGCRTGGMQERRDAGKKECKKGRMQEIPDAGQEEGRKGWMQEMMDAGTEGYNCFIIGTDLSPNLFESEFRENPNDALL